VKVFDADKTRMIGLPYGEKNYDTMLSRFNLISERHGQRGRQTDKIAISISRVSVLTRDKNCMKEKNCITVFVGVLLCKTLSADD